MKNDKRKENWTTTWEISIYKSKHVFQRQAEQKSTLFGFFLCPPFFYKLLGSLMVENLQ